MDKPSTEACLDLLRSAIAADVSDLSLTLEQALAAEHASDDAGLLHALRRARCFWRSIEASAKDFSALRKKETAA